MKLTHITSHLHLDTDLSTIQVQLTEYETKYKNLRFHHLVEDVSDEINQLFNEIQSQLEAAKRGLGLANTLKNPVDRQKHKSRVLGNMNRIRGNLNRVAKQLSAADNLDLDVSDSSGYDSDANHQDLSQRRKNAFDYGKWPRGKGSTNV